MSWKELFPFATDNENAQAITRKKIFPRKKVRASYPVIQERERTFVNVVQNPGNQKSAILRMTVSDRLSHEVVDQGIHQRIRQLRQRQLERARIARHKRETSTDGSDSSNEDLDVFPKAKGNTRPSNEHWLIKESSLAYGSC